MSAPRTDGSVPHFSELVCYIDTDAGGAVHHAAYLRWLERARTGWLRARGGTLAGLAGQGCLLVVARMEVDYLAPLRLDDEIEVTARVAKIGRCSVWFAQEVLRGGREAVRARVLLVAVDTGTGRPRRLPVLVRAG